MDTINSRLLPPILLLFCLITIWLIGSAIPTAYAESTLAASNNCTATPYTANGSITTTVETFRTVLGDLNAPSPFNHLDGRRQINWDAAPAAVSDPNPFAGDFFNFGAFPRARGIEFTTPGSGFLLSGDVDDGTPIEFESIDPSYDEEFTTFSAERLFTPIGSNIVDVTFFSPGDQTTPAYVDGFGAVFTDVDLAGITKLDYYDTSGALIYTLTLNPGWGATSETLSFGGVTFSDVCISRVRITAGNIALANGIVDGMAGYDVVAMDDFIYGEPQPVTDCGLPTLYEAVDDVTGSVEAFRAALGDLNAPAPFNNLDGRRQINWDAAPDAVSAPNPFAGDFFNFTSFPRARGIAFTTSGTGFQLSATAASGEGERFANLNASYADEFGTFSAERLFTPLGATATTANFYNPANNTQRAYTDGFGAVFTDVDLSDITSIAYYDDSGNLLYRLPIDAGSTASGSLSFAGAKFPTECVYSVELISGNTAVGAADNPGEGVDVVVMDDFIFGEPTYKPECGLPTHISKGFASDAAGLTPTVEAFRTSLGDLNAFEPINNPAGRRQINWDAAPAAVSDPNPFAGDFFNFNASPRARGIAFSTTGDGFMLSGDVDDGTPVEFASVNATYPGQFGTFSAERLFSAINSTTTTARFFLPADQVTEAGTTGFGAVFTDVDLDNLTSIDYYDFDQKLIWSQAVPAAGDSAETLSFAGVQFDTACVYFVELTAGNEALVPPWAGSRTNANDNPSEGVDVVVMDDFIYGEPQNTRVTTSVQLTNIATSTTQIASLLIILLLSISSVILIRRRG